jgi:endonuclease YncB( thermonuclease family)
MPTTSLLLLALSIILGPSLELNGTDQSDELVANTTGDAENSTDGTPFVNATELEDVEGTILINEVELNPQGTDMGDEWIELYNPTDIDAAAGELVINTSMSVTLELPDDLVIEGGERAVIHFENGSLSNVAEVLSLLDSSSREIVDATPSLVDSKDDDYTWQRIPDGDEEWEFLEGTQGDLNDPSSVSSKTSSGENTGSGNGCQGTSGCVEGIVIRIVDGDTLYVSADDSVYKVELALVQTPNRDDDQFLDTTMFTRSLCLGSPVLVDQDDGQQANGGSVVASVYCSSIGLNEELLDNELATLDSEQCESSEFAQTNWALEHGC